MGVWGAKLYQNDISQSVRDEFKNKLRCGKTTKEATKEIIFEYSDCLNDIEDANLFWFALADTQWNLGILLPYVKEKALLYINSKYDLQQWHRDNPKQVALREKTLNELKNKLTSPIPPEKKISKYHLYKCTWQDGDVFSYCIDDKIRNKYHISEKYFMFQKFGLVSMYPGHIIPIVRIALTYTPTYKELASSKDKFIRHHCPLKDGKNAYGYELCIKSNHKNKLILVGNYDIITPNDDAGEVCLMHCMWNNLDEYLLTNFNGHNLKHFPIYLHNL